MLDNAEPWWMDWIHCFHSGLQVSMQRLATRIYMTDKEYTQVIHEELSSHSRNQPGIELSAYFCRGSNIATTSTSLAKFLRKIIPPTLHPIWCTHRKQDKLQHEHDWSTMHAYINFQWSNNYIEQLYIKNDDDEWCNFNKWISKYWMSKHSKDDLLSTEKNCTPSSQNHAQKCQSPGTPFLRTFIGLCFMNSWFRYTLVTEKKKNSTQMPMFEMNFGEAFFNFP